ncbi:MAG: TonB-dependent receptor [Hyphomonadaceae bacterium]
MQDYKLAAALVGALLLPAPAWAEADDEVVVTATRTPAPVSALPADVTIIDAERALSRGETTLVEALEAAPGLGAVQSGGAGQQTSLFTGGANSNHTLVLFDGLRINDPSTPGSSFDAGQDQINGLARIEVVEGPMSAVFGSDAVGGVINLIPRHGGEGPLNARLDMSAGSFGTLRGAAGVDGTLGAFRYAVTGEAYATDGYDLVPERIVTHTGDDDGAEMSAVTGVFDLALNEDFSLDLLVRVREARADFDALAYEFIAPFREYRLDDPDLEIAQNDLFVARLGATWAVNETLSLRATYGGIEQQRMQTDGGLLTDAFEGERRFADVVLDWRPGALSGVEDVSVVAGLSSEREDNRCGAGLRLPAALRLPRRRTGADERVRHHARLPLSGLPSPGAAPMIMKSFRTQTTWRVGAYALGGNGRLYAAYSASFRAPTLYERFASFGDPNLEPEQGESWELGGDARFAAFGPGDGIELGMLYRRSEIEDLIDFAGFTYANVDQAEIDTAEARVALRPAPWLTLQAGYVYTDAQDAPANTPLLRRPQDADGRGGSRAWPFHRTAFVAQRRRARRHRLWR